MDRGLCYVHFRRLVGVGVMIAFLATAFVPAVAAQSQAPPTNSNAFSTKSIEKVVADTKVVTEASRRGKDDAPKTPAQATKTGSFFKTRTGLLVLAVMAAGTGYALYSAKEDRIHGSAR